MSKEKFICENCGKEFEIYSSQRNCREVLFVAQHLVKK